MAPPMVSSPCCSLRSRGTEGAATGSSSAVARAPLEEVTLPPEAMAAAPMRGSPATEAGDPVAVPASSPPLKRSIYSKSSPP